MRRLSPFLLLGSLLIGTQCRKQETPPAAPAPPHAAHATPKFAEAFSGDRAHQDVARLDAFGPRPPGSAGYGKALSYLESELANVGWKTHREPFQAKTPDGIVTFVNLTARHRSAATEPVSLPFLIGGHLDSKRMPFPFTGANDSGSSTGLMLEIARALSIDPASASQVELVFFDGEEAFGGSITPTDGLYGSKEFARQLRSRASLPRIGVVVDIVGDPHYPLFCNPDAPASFRTTALRLGKELGFPKGLTTAPGQIIDDHVPLQYVGLPCLHLIGDFTAMDYWHKEGDTLDKVQPQMLDKVGKLVLRFLATPGLLDDRQ
ncbi:hypothetical protein HNR46_004001 [Haloferula luteola]|uniref:Peptidase M28 domain-containing protein n=1 Tax=Haloferula luteola TaxID=595692 RepID=A0A840VIR0_9BACT|nr:hypothetical protein [Haloferula luteola]